MPANQQQASPLLKGSASPKERAASASKGTTLPKQRSSLAAGERLSFKFTPLAPLRRASAATSALASSAAAAAADSGPGSPAGATGSAFAEPGKCSSPGAGKSALTSSPDAGKSALTSSPETGMLALPSSPDPGKSAPTSSPTATQLNAATKSDSAKRGTDASQNQTQSDRISQAGATEPGTARGSDKAKVTTATAAAQPAVVLGLSTSPEVPSVAAEQIAPSASHPYKLPAKFRISLTDTAAASQSDLPDSASVSARVYSPQAEAATQLPQAGLGSTKGKTVAQAEGTAKGSEEAEGEQLADAPPLPQDEGQEVPLPPLPTAASAAAEQAAAAARETADAAAAAQAPPLPPAAAEGAASAAPTAAEQAAPVDSPSISHPSAAQARQSDPPSSQLPPTSGLTAKQDTGPTAKPTAPAPVHVSAAGQPGPSDPHLARKRQREECRNDWFQQTSMPRKTTPSLPSGGLPSRLLPQLPGQLLGVTKPGQPAVRSSSSSQQSQRGPDRDPWGRPWGNPPPSGPVGNAGPLHHSHRNSSYSRPSISSKPSRWDVSTPKQGSPAPTPSIPLSAPTGILLPPLQPDLPTPTAAAAVVPSHGSDRIGAVAYPAQQQQGSAATSGPFSPQFGSGNSQQAASEQDAAEWHILNPEMSDDCQTQVVQLRYRWGKSHGEDRGVKGVLSLKARTWSAKRMGRLASESGILSCLVLRHDRTTVPALASLHFSLACLALDFHQVSQPVSAFAL